MKTRTRDEFEKFDDAMGKLLSVPHADLKKKLEEDKKAKKQERPTSSGRVSSKGS